MDPSQKDKQVVRFTKFSPSEEIILSPKTKALSDLEH